MRRVTVPLGERAYDIVIGRSLLERAVELMDAAGVGSSVAVVADANVAPTYGKAVADSLRAGGRKVSALTVPAGESSKSLTQLGRLYEELAGLGLDRGSALVSVGGGVTGDLVGFAAATYLRGIDYVQVPTTLLAQVDASVGGKTAIDLPAGKNLVGAFHQPRLVLIDLDTLSTLPDRELRAGLAEVIKYGVIADPALMDYLAEQRDAILAREPGRLSHLVARSCEIKAEVVGGDERESGRRAILNYGHTVGHSIEVVAGYGAYRHGEAVAIGMAAAGRVSQDVLGWSLEEASRVDGLLRAYGLPTKLHQALPEVELLEAMMRDKKTVGGSLRMVLARRLGEVELCEVGEDDARRALRAVQP